jgi:hypothetical protein
MKMKLLRITSIAGLGAVLADHNTRITNNAGAITTINGDADTPGSILNGIATANTYTDNAIGNIDLSQVALNQTAIALLNDADTVDGSVAKAVKDAKTAVEAQVVTEVATLQTGITANTDAITVLNGDSTVVGSVKKAIADVVGAAPETLDTFAEIATKLADQDNLYTALVTTIANNKTLAENNLADHITNYNTYQTTVADRFVSERAAVDTYIASEIATLVTASDAKYFQVTNLFNEITTAENRATARANIGAVSEAEVVTLVNSKRTLHRLENVAVASGKIVLDGRVGIEHIDHINRVYLGNEFDTLPSTPNGTAGEYTVFANVAGDLDGETVEVKYVIDQTL